MTAYVGPLFDCPPIVADRMGLREGQKVAHLTADTAMQMVVAAEELGLPENRQMGHGTVRWRCYVTALERNRAISHLGVQPMDARDMARAETVRADAYQAAMGRRR